MWSEVYSEGARGSACHCLRPISYRRSAEHFPDSPYEEPWEYDRGQDRAGGWPWLREFGPTEPRRAVWPSQRRGSSSGSPRSAPRLISSPRARMTDAEVDAELAELGHGHADPCVVAQSAELGHVMYRPTGRNYPGFAQTAAFKERSGESWTDFANKAAPVSPDYYSDGPGTIVRNLDAQSMQVWVLQNSMPRAYACRSQSHCH